MLKRRKENGVWCFDIHPSAETSVKTKSSIRLVPIHSYLIKAGFIKYCEEIRKEGHAQLFPVLKQSANGYGSAISKWFNKKLREKGIADKKKVLHSTRHTFITKLKQLDIQDHLISELVGHTAESITVGRYGKKLDVMYRMAWLKGLKTTYYLRSKGATTAEKSTIHTGELNAVSTSSETAPLPETCSITDPECDACQ